ncbi:MAG: S-layer protein, partial [Planctomycetota bacterium]
MKPTLPTYFANSLPMRLSASLLLVIVLWAVGVSSAIAAEPSSPSETAASVPVSFVNDVVPTMTKVGCNAGGCHGKATGQNGFKLSLFGFEPQEDYEHLVYEQRGRRIIPSAPEASLLLTKGSGQVPHGGGKRIEPGTPQYELLRRWIAQGMPNDVEDPKRATLVTIEVVPPVRTMKKGESVPIVVNAIFSDGKKVDVTAQTVIEPNTKGLA